VPETPSGRQVELDDIHVLSIVGRAVESEADNRILDAFAREITSSLALEELTAEASEAGTLAAAGDLRTAILSAVSHDLRTPLSGIKASVTSLLQEDVEWTPEAHHEFLLTIDEESDRLNDLVGNLLDMSRLQTGALEVSLSAVGVDEVIPAALASIGARAVEVDVDVDETHPRVLADPGLLERALANVIVNALNHSPPGERVRVVAGAAGDAVDVRVVDRGPGVPPGDRETVFLPFQRLGDTGGGDGVGLGLAVARGFVEAIGGDVEIEDTPGGGLTMVFRLKAAQ
jgi:two-component system sensor histidine kinase KdpD